jgi:hypothetical protein
MKATSPANPNAIADVRLIGVPADLDPSKPNSI